MLQNITIANCSTLTHENIVFGGAVINNGELTVINSTFKNNYGGNGGGAVFNNGTMYVINSTFTDNSVTGSPGGGGAIDNNATGDLTVINSTFTNNYALSGGAIRSNGTGLLSVENSTFIQNKATGGGAIYSSTYEDLIITNSTFIQNTATDTGGAIQIHYVPSSEDRTPNIEITNSTFIENSATGTSGWGGAIHIRDNRESTEESIDTTVSGSTFIGNYALYGGAIDYYTSGSLTVTDSTFTENIAEGYHAVGGAIRNYADAKLTIKDSTFTENTANYEGGAIATYSDGEFTVSGSTFIRNVAENEEGSDTYGGAIFDHVSTSLIGIDITDSTFIENSAVYGGAVYALGDGTVEVIDSTFTENTATTYGGALYLQSANGIISGSSFTENTATTGGAIHQRNSDSLTIDKDSTFTENIATSNGGALYIRNIDSVSIENATFTENIATYGGAIYSYYTSVDSSIVTITGSTFTENTATYGGAIYNYMGSLEVSASDFIENIAYEGGAIENAYGTITIKESSTFTKNKASDTDAEEGYGGAIMNWGGIMSISQATFEENSAITEGGAIYNHYYSESYPGILTISNSEFKENTAQWYGGAIFNDEGTIEVSTSDFIENTAFKGGAIENDYGTITIQYDSTFIRNKVTGMEIYDEYYDGYGGAISNYGGDMTISNAIFEENSADNGGAVHNYFEDEDYPGTLVIEDSKFYTNTATEYGGAIYNEGGDLTLTGNYFEGNEGYYKDTIFTDTEIKMTKNTIIMSDYDTNTFTELNMYSPIIDTTAKTDANAERDETIIYDINHPSEYDSYPPEKKTSEVITMDADTFETYLDYTVKDGGIYKVEIVYRNSENYISYNVYSHDLTHITLDSGIVATPGHTITINGSLISTNEDQAYDDYSNKNVTVYINGELKYKELYIDIDGHFEFEITPVEGYNSIYVVYDGYIIDKTTYIAGSSNITGFNTNDHNAIITATPEKNPLNVTQSTNINGLIYDLEENPLEGTILVQISNGTETTVEAENGKFQYNFEPLTEGTYTFLFSYETDEYTAVSEPVYVTVVRTNTNIIIDTSNVKIGEDSTITITLHGDFGYNIANADLVVSVNGVNKPVTDLGDGSYTIQTGTLTEGTYTIIAYFEGDNIYYGSQNIATFRLSKTYTNIKITYTTTEIGGTTTITATLTDDQGHPVVDRNVVISLNGVNHTNYNTNKNGEVYIVTGDLTAGMYTIEAYFDGDDIYYASHATTEFNLARTHTILEIKYVDTEIVGEKGTVTITLTDDQEIPIANAPVTVMINGVKSEIDRTNDNGQIIIYTDVLTASTFTIEAYYDGNATYYESHASETFSLSKIITYLEVIPENMVIGETGTITATLTDDQGNYIENAPVTISINGVDYNHITDNNGQITIQTDVLTAGTYTIEAYYEGNNTYYESHDSKVVTLSKLETKVHIDHLGDITPGEEVNITGILTLSDGSTPIAFASLVVIINGEEYPEDVVTDESGHFSIPYTVPSNGQLDIVVLYRGSDIYENSYDEDVDTSDLPPSNRTNIPTTTTVGGIIGEFGETVNLTAIVLDEDSYLVPEGQVLFKINDVTVKDENGNILYADVVNGVARLPYTITNSPKNYTIMAVYQGTDTYLPSSSNYALLIVEASEKIPTTTIVDSITGQKGETVNLTATVYDEDGNLVDEGKLIFKINDVTLKDEDGNVIYVDVENGVAKLPYTITNNPKNYTIMAVYQGTDKYMESRSDYATLTVEGEVKNKIPTTTVVEGITGQKGETVNLTATVYDEYGNLVPEGQVLFKLNDVTIKDENGNILYADVVNGVAKLPYTITNSPKNYTLLAIYQGTDNYYSSKSDYSTLYVVAEDTKIPTVTYVDSITAREGETVNLTATVYDKNQNKVTEGQVYFEIDNQIITDSNGNILYATVVDGVAKLPYTVTQNIGNYTLKAVYTENNKYYGSESDTNGSKVGGGAGVPTLTVVGENYMIPTSTTVNGVTAKQGDEINLTANVVDEYGNPVSEGQLSFKIDGVSITDTDGNIIYVDVTDGVAKLPYTVTQDLGNYTITAEYYGTDKYLPSQADDTVVPGSAGKLVVVDKDANITTNIVVDDAIQQWGDVVKFTATITDEYGNPVTGGKVAFKLNGVTIKDGNGDVRYVQVVDGKVELYYTVTNNVKDYTITTVYSGYDIFESSRSNEATLTVTPRSVNMTTDKLDDNIKSGDTVTFKATISEYDRTYTDNGVVVFKLNGKTIKDEEGNPIVVDVNNGVATLDYQIPVDFAGKDYNITAVYTNNNYLRAEANNTLTTVRSNIQTELNPITVSHGQDANIYMVLYDENGNQLERETKVAIKINGHTIIHMNTTAGVLNATIPASEITQTTNRIDVVLGENQGYYELRLNTTLRVES